MIKTAASSTIFKLYKVYTYLYSNKLITTKLSEKVLNLIMNGIMTKQSIEIYVNDNNESNELSTAIARLYNACHIDFNNIYKDESIKLRAVVCRFNDDTDEFNFAFTDFSKFNDNGTQSISKQLYNQNHLLKKFHIADSVFTDISVDEIYANVDKAVASINQLVVKHVEKMQINEIEGI